MSCDAFQCVQSFVVELGIAVMYLMSKLSIYVFLSCRRVKIFVHVYTETSEPGSQTPRVRSPVTDIRGTCSDSVTVSETKYCDGRQYSPSLGWDLCNNSRNTQSGHDL